MGEPLEQVRVRVRMCVRVRMRVRVHCVRGCTHDCIQRHSRVGNPLLQLFVSMSWCVWYVVCV